MQRFFGMILYYCGRKTTGDRKMSKDTKRTDDETVTDKVVCDRLPKLEKVWDEHAKSHEMLSWAHQFMLDHKYGQVKFLNNVGVNLQKVNDSTVRCIAVVDHPDCFVGLSCLKSTFETAEIEIEIDPYALVIPYTPKDEEGSCEVVEVAPGLEVA